jgi:hypothetical protein
MTDTFVDASEIFEQVKREAAVKRQAEAESIWPVMDEAAFYGLAGDVVRTIEPDSESDPVAILAQYLNLETLLAALRISRLKATATPQTFS